MNPVPIGFTKIVYDRDPKFRARWDRIHAGTNNVPERIRENGKCVGCQGGDGTLIQRVKGLRAEVETWVKAGKPITPDDELAKRTATCENCPSEGYDKEKDKCSYCGCGMKALSMKAKLSVLVVTGVNVPGKLHMATSQCPKKYWKSLIVLNETGEPVPNDP